MVSTISPQQLAELLTSDKPIRLIDVRTPAEFGEVHVTNAHNLPLDRLDAAAVTAEASGDEPIYFICKSGGRSGKACEKLIAAGFTNVISVAGGTTACETAGLPVVRGRKAMSLERCELPPGHSSSGACCWRPLPTTPTMTCSRKLAWGLPALSAPAWSLPASPIPAAWRC